MLFPRPAINATPHFPKATAAEKAAAKTAAKAKVAQIIAHGEAVKAAILARLAALGRAATEEEVKATILSVEAEMGKMNSGGSRFRLTDIEVPPVRRNVIVAVWAAAGF